MADQIDDALLTAIGGRWRKVAMVIVKAADHLGWKSDEELDRIAERLRALVAEARFEAQGDLSLWRESEVRLRP